MCSIPETRAAGYYPDRPCCRALMIELPVGVPIIPADWAGGIGIGGVVGTVPGDAREVVDAHHVTVLKHVKVQVCTLSSPGPAHAPNPLALVDPARVVESAEVPKMGIYTHVPVGMVDLDHIAANWVVVD